MDDVSDGASSELEDDVYRGLPHIHRIVLPVNIEVQRKERSQRTHPKESGKKVRRRSKRLSKEVEDDEELRDTSVSQHIPFSVLIPFLKDALDGLKNEIATRACMYSDVSPAQSRQPIPKGGAMGSKIMDTLRNFGDDLIDLLRMKRKEFDQQAQYEIMIGEGNSDMPDASATATLRHQLYNCEKQLNEAKSEVRRKGEEMERQHGIIESIRGTLHKELVQLKEGLYQQASHPHPRGTESPARGQSKACFTLFDWIEASGWIHPPDSGLLTTEKTVHMSDKLDRLLRQFRLEKKTIERQWRNEVDRQELQNSILRKRVTELESRLQENIENISAGEETQPSQREEVERLSTELLNLDEARKNEGESFEKEIRMLKSQLRDLQHALTDSSMSRVQQQDSSEEMNTRFKEERLELTRKHRKEMAAATHAAQKAEKVTLSKECALFEKLKSSEERYEKLLSESQRELDILREENSSSRSTIVSMSKRLSSLESGINAVEREKSDLLKQVAHARQKLKESA